MAKDAKPAEEGAETPKKSKKLLIIILAVVLVIVLAGGGAAYMLLKKAPHGEDDEDTPAEETSKPKKKDKKAEAAHPIFVNLETFTVNLIPETGDQYLQVILSIELEDVLAEPSLKAQMPKIRNNIMLLLSSKKASELLPKEGKEQLAEALKEEINNVIEPPKKNKKGETIKSEGPAKAVLFTSFIIQ